jgi:hypothetical protein
MIIVKRVRKMSMTAAMERIVNKAIRWAAKSGMYDRVKVVNVDHAPGNNTHVRAVMSRVIKNGDRELWLNVNARRGLTLGMVKRHINDTGVHSVIAAINNHSADKNLTVKPARNRISDVSQRTSRMVKITVDLVRNLPGKVMMKLMKPIRSHVAVLRQRFNGESIALTLTNTVVTKLDLVLYHMNLVSSGAASYYSCITVK